MLPWTILNSISIELIFEVVFTWDKAAFCWFFIFFSNKDLFEQINYSYFIWIHIFKAQTRIHGMNEFMWGKALTLDQVQRREWSLANRCYLCQIDEELIDHILVHLVKTRVLWELLFALFGFVGAFIVGQRDTSKLTRFICGQKA